MTRRLRRLLRRVLQIGLSVLLLAAVLLLAVWMVAERRLSRHYQVPPAALTVPADDAGRAEGRRLFLSRGCADCHDVDFAGRVALDDLLAGTIAGPNLTSGAGGIGERSDVELERAIRHGVAPDGRALRLMPSHEFYPLSDAEIGAMIAALRAAPPVDRASVPPRVGLLMRLLFLLGQAPVVAPAESIDHAAPRPPAPEVGATPAYGAYLANLCVGCHGAGLSGGPIPGVPPDWPPGSNLTPDPSGLGGWSEADFVRAMREGISREGDAIDPVMPWRNFSQMTDLELRALWLHLSALPPRPAGGR